MKHSNRRRSTWITSIAAWFVLSAVGWFVFFWILSALWHIRHVVG